MARDITTVIEEAMIAELEKTGLFKQLDSLGRGAPDNVKARTYPMASVYFDGDNDDTDRASARPVPDFYYTIMIKVMNRAHEKDSARDAYSIMDEVRDLFNGKQLGVDGIEPVRLVRRRILAYVAGEITYGMRFRVPVVLAPIR